MTLQELDNISAALITLNREILAMHKGGSIERVQATVADLTWLIDSACKRETKRRFTAPTFYQEYIATYIDPEDS